MSINRVNISGNLVRDADVKQSQGGMAVCQFTLAVNERRKDDMGEWRDFPNYIDCTMFGARAERLGPMLRKGKYAAIDGKLRQRKWEAKDGGKRSKLEVVVDDVDLGPKLAGPTPTQSVAKQEQLDGGLYDRDIPF